MTAEKSLTVGVACYPYSGTSSGSSLAWDIVPWLLHVQKWCANDKRVKSLVVKDFNDTPITMTRNATVEWALRSGIDVLVMVDADMSPDCEMGKDPSAKPFFPTSFDFIHRNWDRGPHSVCAPYCGPPPISNPYIFKWASGFEGLRDNGFKLEMYSREEAAIMSGIQECAAQPTGLIMFDTRIFSLTDPKTYSVDGGWFYYEWTSQNASQKASTEDVTATRDLSLAGHAMLGREVNYVNWDAWAGHNKVYCVGKPRPLTADCVSKRLAGAFQRGVKSNERFQIVDFGMKHGNQSGTEEGHEEVAGNAGGAAVAIVGDDARDGGCGPQGIRRSLWANEATWGNGEKPQCQLSSAGQNLAGCAGVATEGACG